MPNWRKLIYSGSDASLANITATTISGSFSGSYVGDGSGLTGVVATIPSDIVSSSAQFRTITSPFTGSFTGSFKGDGSGILNVISASYAANGGGAAATYSIIGSSILSGSVNDWDPSGLSSANVVYVASPSQSYGINGIVSQSVSRAITLVNTGSSLVYLASDHPSSSAWNRIEYTEDILLTPRQSVGLIYDTSKQKWVVSNYTPYVGYKIVSAVVTPGSVTAGDYSNVVFTVTGSGAITNSTSMTAYIGAPTWRIATGTSVPGGATIATNKSSVFLGYVGYTHMSCEFIMSIQTLSDATDTYVIEAGLSNRGTVITEPLAQTAGIRYTHTSSSGNWEGISVGTSGIPRIVDLGVPVAINKVYSLRTEINAPNTEVRFYINGNMVGIIPTTNSPATINSNNLVGARILLSKNVGTTNRFIYVSQIITRIGLTL